MEKCANCDTEAKYAVENPSAERQLFCSHHLPLFLRNNNPEYLHPYVVVLADVVVAKPKAKAKKAATLTPVVEDVNADSENNN